ncbi:Coiled-coil domain-containing protein 42A, partial [Apaloderma vittatum]
DSLSPFIHLQEKRKQAQLKQSTLEEKEEDFRERVKAITRQWRDFHTKDAQLKTYMNKSEKILKEDDMPVKALAKDSKKRERRMQKETELLEVKRKLEALRNEHQKLRDEVQKYLIFNKCLEDVVKISQFEELQEVIWYYKMLMRMHKAQLQSQQEYKEMSEQANMLLDQYMAEKEAENLQYKDELMQLQLRFDQAQKDILLQETWWDSIQDKIAKKSRKLRIIKMVSLNISQ